MLHLLGIFKEVAEGIEVFKEACTFRSSMSVVSSHFVHLFTHSLFAFSGGHVEICFSVMAHLDLVLKLTFIAKFHITSSALSSVLKAYSMVRVQLFFLLT